MAVRWEVQGEVLSLQETEDVTLFGRLQRKHLLYTSEENFVAQLRFP